MRPLPVCLALLAAASPAGAEPTALGAPSAVEPMPFGEAVRRAVAHATIARVAGDEVRRAEALLVQARSASLPQIAASGTLTRTSEHHLDAGVGGSRLLADDARSGSVSFSLPLVAPSRWYQWAHASDQVAVAGASEVDVQRTAALVAARAWLSVLASRRAVEVSRRAVEVGRAHLEFARARRAAGAGGAVDEVRADQQLAQAEVQLESALAALLRSQEALGVATGSDRPLDAEGEPDLSVPPAGLDELTRDAERSRPDVRLARERAGAAHRLTRDSWSDWAPSLLLTGQAFANDPANPPSTFRDGWQAQLVLSFPLFEGLLRTGTRDERAALEAEARDQLDGVERLARSDVRTAAGTLEHAVAALAGSRRAAQRAQDALALVAEAWRAGAVTSLDVTDADQRARDADVVAVVAEDAVRQAQLDLLAVTGRFP
jgi:outer membrane protein TolC